MSAKEAEKKDLEEDVKSVPGFGLRHVQTLLLFSMLVVGYGMRINLSVGIVAMTDPTVSPNMPSYDWSIGVKSTMLSAFFWGYVPPQLFAGRLAELYGPRWFLTGAMTVSTVFTALIPAMATAGPWGVILCRVIQGLSQGFFFPSIQYLMGKWTPLSERSRTASFIYAGGPLGTVICMPVTGWLAASTIGWPSAFYLYAILGTLWSLVWLWYGSNSPEENDQISEEEKRYIQETTGAPSTKKYPTPFLHMLKSLPLWGILIAFCGQNWGYWTLLTEIPTYMSGVLHFNISENGLLSASPYFALWIASFFISAAADYLINNKILSVNTTRKLASAIGLSGPGIALLILGIIGSPSRAEALTLLIIAVAINAGVLCGHQVNHIEIAPTHAATLMGITNGLGNVFSIIAPFIVQYVVTDESDPDQWKIVFFIAAGIYIGTDLIYTLTGKANVQYWDKLEKS